MERDPELERFNDPEVIAQLAARRDNRVAQQTRVAEARHLQLVSKAAEDAPFLKEVAAGVAKWDATARDHRAKHCARCESPRSAIGDACGRRFETETIDGSPLCRFAGDRGAYMAEDARRTKRLHRLTMAGIVNAEMRDTLTVARDPADALAMTAALIPAKPANATKAAYLAAPRLALGAVESFLRARTSHLFLNGTKGTWKTWAAASCVAEFDNAVWIAMSQIIPAASWSAIVERCRTAPVVVLSDAGTEDPPSPNWSRSAQIAQLIIERDDSRLPVIVTANLTMAEFGVRYGDRALDRMQRAITAYCEGPSLREVIGGRG